MVVNFCGFLIEFLFLDYAHMEIVVVLIVVKKLGFLVITRDHGSFGGRHQVEILPTGLPELFKPSRDLLELRKTNILQTTCSKEIREQSGKH